MVRSRWFRVLGGSALGVMMVAAVLAAGNRPARAPVAAPRSDRAADAACRSPMLQIEPARCVDGVRIEGRQGVPESVGEHLNGFNAWFYGQRAAPAKRIPSGARLAAVRQARVIQARHRGVSAAAGAWTTLGPAPLDNTNPTYADPVWSNYGSGWQDTSGRVTSLAVDPDDSDVVYLGSADGGVWKTMDGGANWTPIGESDFGTQSIGAVTVVPRDPATVFVGTGEANTSSDSYWGDGLYRSTDAGANFTKVSPPAFDKLTIFRILTRGDGHLVFAATNRGLYRSLDGGDTWTRVLAPGNPLLFESFVTDVQFIPGEARHMVAAVGWRGGKTTNGLYESTDRGTSWTFLASPPGFAPQPNVGRVALASGPGVLYAAVQDAQLFNTPGACTVFNGVYKSTTGPAGPWTEVQSAAQLAANQSSALTPEHTGFCYQPGVQAWYNLYVTVDPTDPNDVMLGLEEVWNSSDGGTTWEAIARYWNYCAANPTNEPWCNSGPTEHPTPHPDQHGYAWGLDGSGNPIFYAGNDGGPNSQTGPSWSNEEWSYDLNETLSTIQCYSVAASGDGTITCGTQDNGFIKYTGSQKWPVIAGGDGGFGTIDPDDSDNLIGEYTGLQAYLSNNGGSTYRTIAPNDPNPRFISPIVDDPANPTHIAAVGQKVWFTKKGYDTTHFNAIHDLGFPRQGTALAVRGKTRYVGWCGPCNPASFASDAPFQSGVVVKPDGAGTWREADGIGLPNRYVSFIVRAPADPSHIWVTLSGYSRHWIPYAGTGHVFESTDGGDHFTDISAGLPDAPANVLLRVNGDLIVGTDVGVFERTGGGSWFALGTGMPPVAVVGLVMIPGTNTLVASTHGRGVYTLDLGA